jgi:hypothetical protein
MPLPTGFKPAQAGGRIRSGTESSPRSTMSEDRDRTPQGEEAPAGSGLMPVLRRNSIAGNWTSLKHAKQAMA